jgi:hypothetical protein
MPRPTATQRRGKAGSFVSALMQTVDDIGYRDWAITELGFVRPTLTIWLL